MDTNFWIGLLLPLVLSIPLGIIANMYSDPVREFALKRRHIRLSKKRSREIRMHRRVLAIKKGDPTELAFLQFGQFVVILSLILAMSAAAAVVALVVFRAQILPHISEALWYTAYFIVAVIGSVGFAATGLLLNEIRLIMFKVRRFEQYEDQMRAKWGPDLLTDADDR